MFIKQLLGLVCLLFVSAVITFAQGTPSLSINDITVPEGDTNFFQRDFTITLSAPSTQTVSFTVTTQEGVPPALILEQGPLF